jgi:ATP-dependent DNA helicase RecG
MKETQHIEWKESWRDEYLRWICGFANAEGGVLVIGRNDRGEAVGVKDASRLLQDIPNKVRDILGIMVDVNLIEEAGKETVEIVVEPYPSPVSYKGEYHYRSGSTKQELKGAALDRFLLRKQGLHWDGVPVPYVTLADLDDQPLAYFRNRAEHSGRLSPAILRETDTDLIDKLHLMEGRYLKRAAVLLFHPDPERFVTGAFVKIGYFLNDADLLYQDEVHGDLFTQVNETVDRLLIKYLKARISYEGVQRVETYPVPEEALREAVTNAIAYKDYASATPIQISVYDDKIMLWNPGHLPSGWTAARLLKKHLSEPYNPDVANAFFRAGMIEAWGRGIEKILAACQAAGVSEPELRYEHTGLWVVFTFRPEAILPKAESQPESQPESISLEARVLTLLASAGPMSKSALSGALGQKEVSGHLNQLMRRLVTEQWVAYTIPDKPQSRLQKYRLTAEGRVRLATFQQGKES